MVPSEAVRATDRVWLESAKVSRPSSKKFSRRR
jgi:hypothetical protein